MKLAKGRARIPNCSLSFLKSQLWCFPFCLPTPLVLFLFLITSYMLPRRRQWHPTPVLLPGKSHGWRSLEGCSPWGHKESDTTERLHFHFSFSCIEEGNGSPLQCSCLENPGDGGAWWAAIYGVAHCQTWLKRLSSSSISYNQFFYLMILVYTLLKSSFHDMLLWSFLFHSIHWRKSLTTVPPESSLINQVLDKIGARIWFELMWWVPLSW